MTYPSFSAGDILTAADMNAVGLWLVKTQTIGSAVSSVTVTDAFSSTYDNYVITVAGGAHSTGGQVMTISLGAATSAFYYSMVYTSWNNTVTAAGAANVANIVYVGDADTTGLRARIEVMSPYLAKPTGFSASVRNGTFYGGTTNGLHISSTSYTSFVLGLSGGTMTGGTIRVYGYRN